MRKVKSNKILLTSLLASMLAFSCQVGLGEAVDVTAPEIKVSLFQNSSILQVLQQMILDLLLLLLILTVIILLSILSGKVLHGRDSKADPGLIMPLQQVQVIQKIFRLQFL